MYPFSAFRFEFLFFWQVFLASLGGRLHQLVVDGFHRWGHLMPKLQMGMHQWGSKFGFLFLDFWVSIS